MKAFPAAMLCLAVLSACEAQDAADQSGPVSSATSFAEAAKAVASAQPTSTAGQVPPGVARDEEIHDELIDFEYSYPASAGAIPGLKSMLDADLARRKAELIESAREGREAAQEGGFPFNSYGYWAAWKAVTDLPGWLSLSADISTYQGGAHPNHGFDSLVWDRQANRRLDPEAMFSSAVALSRAIRAPFCRALDVQRREKRGGEGKLGSISEFDQCIDPIENGTLILGSSNRKAFDRLGILVPPYNAGPYAEGSYEVTLPVTPAVMAAVKPEYRPTFVVAQ